MSGFDIYLDQIARRSEKLNHSDDSIKRILDDSEERIRGTGIQIEVWLSDHIEEVGRKTGEFYSYEPEDQDIVTSGTLGWGEIGWARIESEWRLAYRDRIEAYGQDHHVNQAWTTVKENFRRSLHDAPRSTRICAVSLLDRLAYRLDAAARHHVEEIDSLEKSLLPGTDARS